MYFSKMPEYQERHNYLKSIRLAYLYDLLGQEKYNLVIAKDVIRFECRPTSKKNKIAVLNSDWTPTEIGLEMAKFAEEFMPFLLKTDIKGEANENNILVVRKKAYSTLQEICDSRKSNEKT